jgi:hypothetical protein
MSDDLRRRVAELEATVRGLTQELVEANERINQLEDQAEEESTTAATPADPSEPEAPDQDTEDTEDSELDDIIVA